MQIKVVSSREEILSIPPEETIVHLSFRPSIKDIFQLVDTCEKLEAVQLPKSYFETVANAIKMFLQKNKISLIEGDVWGHRGDLYAYYTVPEQIINTISDLKEKQTPVRDIETKIAQVHRLSPSLASYIVKNAAQ